MLLQIGDLAKEYELSKDSKFENSPILNENDSLTVSFSEGSVGISVLPNDTDILLAQSLIENTNLDEFTDDSVAKIDQKSFLPGGCPSSFNSKLHMQTQTNIATNAIDITNDNFEVGISLPDSDSRDKSKISLKLFSQKENNEATEMRPSGPGVLDREWRIKFRQFLACMVLENTLSEHFEKHFDLAGAIEKYNQSGGFLTTPQSP